MLSSVAGSLMPVSIVSTTMRAIFLPPLFPWSLDKETKERTDQTKFDQLTPPSWRKVIQTKLRQNLMLDLGGCTGRLRACPFLEGRSALLRGGFVWDAAMVSKAGTFLLDGRLQHHFQGKNKRYDTPYVIAAGRYFPEARKTTGSGDGTRP